MVPVLGPLEKDISDKVLVAYSPTDARIISNSRSGIAILDAQGDITLGPVHTRQSVQSAIFSPDGNSIIVAQTDGFVQVLKAGSEDKPTVIRPPISNRSDWITSIAASPDGTRIAVGSIRASLSMYDANNGLLIYDPLGGCTNEPRALAFSPDSSRVVSGSFATILVRDAGDGSVALGPLLGHTDWVHSVEYSSGGTYIVSGARDSAICLWDAQTGQLALGPMKFHTAPVRSVRFSRDGTCIVSGSDDKAIRVTDIRKESQFVSLHGVSISSKQDINSFCPPLRNVVLLTQLVVIGH
jgi:WD40 repeat protein